MPDSRYPVPDRRLGEPPPFNDRAPEDVPDHSTLAGARALCQRLDAVWRAAGWTNQRFWCKAGGAFSEGDASRVTAIRSNLVDGMPHAAPRVEGASK